MLADFIQRGGFAKASGIRVLLFAVFIPAPGVVGLPDDGIARRFNDLVKPMIERIRRSIFEQIALAALRDALLPKLISGELRVSIPAVEQAPIQPIVEQPAPKHSATDEFKEAILIASLVRAFAKPNFPLGRKRYNKFAYMVHRKAEHDVQQNYLNPDFPDGSGLHVL